jgi:putative transcriptional regulator
VIQPAHHPDGELLFRYASGELREIKSLLVATHLAYCPACRSRVEAFEAQCGAWFEDLEPEPARQVGEDRLAALLDRLDELPALVPGDPGPGREPAASPVPQAGLIPDPLRSRLGMPVDACAWNDIAPGVWLSQWSLEAAGTSVCLLRMAAGATVPPHRHTATEILLVLRGAFGDEYGNYGVGDVIEYAPESDHHASATSAGECICLFLLDGEIIFFK